MCPFVRHTPVLYRNGCTDRGDIFLAGFPQPMLRYVLGYLRNKGTSLWNFVPNSGLRKFRTGTPTVDKCDINYDSGRSGVYSTSGGDGPTADVHGIYVMPWLKLHWFDFLSICCELVVQHAVQQV